jgi:hypothetical protein
MVEMSQWGDQQKVQAAFQFAPPRDVWPCRKCGNPEEIGHHPGCFWANWQQGAVQGMRYAWTPQEAGLGAIIEQQEDAVDGLRAERDYHADKARRWRIAALLNFGCIVGLVVVEPLLEMVL